MVAPGARSALRVNATAASGVGGKHTDTWLKKL